MKTKWTKAAAVDAMTKCFADSLFATWRESMFSSIAQRSRRERARARGLAYDLTAAEARKTVAAYGGAAVSVIAAVFALVLAGCGSPSRVVVLQHPMTKQTVECRVDPQGDIRRRTQIRNCVNAYSQAGYVVVGDSENESGKPVLDK